MELIHFQTDSIYDNLNSFKLLADSLPQMIWILQADGNVEYYNQKWLEYTGLTLDQTRNLGWSTVIHPEDLEKAQLIWKTAIKTGSSFEVEYRFIGKNG